MDWDQARIFLAVARSGQILGAAQKLGLDHATVSRRLTSLENELRAKLFERRPTGCTLTPAGEQFHPIAERVEAELMRAQALIAGSDLTVSGTVRIGAPDGFGTYFLAAELGALAERHPHLVLQLVPLPRTFSLTKREADIAVTLERPTTGRLVSRKLVDYTLSAYVSRSHLDRHGRIRDASDLKDRTLVSYVADLVYSPSLDYFAELEQLMARRYECASVAAQLEAVRAGVGVGILHDYAAKRFPDLVRILPAMSVERTYWLVTHADVRHLRRIVEVHDFIASRTRANRSLFS